MTGAEAALPEFLHAFIRPGDSVLDLSTGLASQGEFLIERPGRPRPRQWLLATIGYASQPKEGDQGFYVRAELPKIERFRVLILSGTAIRRYFYMLDEERLHSQTLYEILGVDESASLADLRLAWRVRSVELGATPCSRNDRAMAERAFNLLSHPDLRNCYDRLRQEKDAPPLFPYGGFGSIWVEGQISKDGDAFFADRILSFRPQLTRRKLTIPLRRCEFLADRVVYLDPRRNVDVSLDGPLLHGLAWDLTWNQWKQRMKLRIEVDATFVHAGKYRFRKGEWILREWFAALPSRMAVSMPMDLANDIAAARDIHKLLGEHAELVAQARDEIAKVPVEHTVVQRWFDELGASHRLKPQHVTWMPEFEPYYFESLRRRSVTWFLFRDEYLFLWPEVLIAEVPQLGHATYLFARPGDLSKFLRAYAAVGRDDIRHNQSDIATKLGFVGRVVRGRRKARWLQDVQRLAGEKADYVAALD